METGEEKVIEIYGRASDALVKEIVSHIDAADEENCREKCEAIYRLLCAAVEQAQAASEKRQGVYKCIGRGSTSCCYALAENASARQRPSVVKEFCPTEGGREETAFAPACVGKDFPKKGFVWIADNAKKDGGKAVKFLQSFKRYLRQKETINHIAGLSRAQKVSNFINPDLHISSAGLIFISDAVVGGILQDKLEKNEYGDDFRCGTVKNKLRVLHKVAKSVEVYHRGGVFNGDLKPSNLFVLDEGNRALTVRNIDYDTCLDTNTIESPSFFDTVRLRATASFYPTSGLRELAKIPLARAKEQLKNLDVAALGNILIYMLLPNAERAVALRECRDDGLKLAYKYFGFDKRVNGVARRLFEGLGCASSLGGLAVVKKIQELVRASVLASHEKRMGVQEFLQKLGVILAYLDLLDAPENFAQWMKGDAQAEQGVAQSEVLYFANLRRLDALLHDKGEPPEYEYSHKYQENTPEKYARQKFYGGGSKTAVESQAGGIDKRRLPSIKCGGATYAYRGGETPLEQALTAADGKSLYLVGDGGRGKSTTLFSHWLEHLQDSLYIDMHLLSGSDGERAISEYIKKHYGVRASTLPQGSVLLLDGANESPAGLRAAKGGSCRLLDECRSLTAGGGVRLVTSSRSRNITTRTPSAPNERPPKNEAEFNDGQMQYCDLLLLEDEVLDTLVDSVNKSSALYQLLKNNIMLSMYTNLKAYTETISEKITAGKLLDLYFDIWFRRNYIKGSLEGGDVFLENAKKSEFEKIFKYLVQHSFSNEFDQADMEKEGISYSELEHLSILKKSTEGKYVWANEVYQEYFAARSLIRAIQVLTAHDSSDEQKKIAKKAVSGEYGYQRPDGQSGQDKDTLNQDHLYKTIQYAGEIAGIHSSDIDYLFAKREGDEAYERFVLRLSVLTGNGFPTCVTCIGFNAFRGCGSIREIKIPQSVTSIEAGAFSECSSLTGIEIPQSVTSIGLGAFAHCSSLTSIEIPQSVTSIGLGAFFGCSSLTSIEIPNSVMDIGVYAFFGCSSLTSIEINSVKRIGDYAFFGCRSLTSIEINSATSIGVYAFAGCRSLTSIKIPAGVAIIEENTFARCSGLTSIEIPETVIHITDRAFFDCSRLTSIKIPTGVRSIGKGAFAGCSSLTSIEIPKKVTHIKDEAFAYCRGLTSVKIPLGVIRIGKSAFVDCSSLTNIEIPHSVESIEMTAFLDCAALKTVRIPRSVGKMSFYVFFGCDSLEEVICEAESKPLGWHESWLGSAVNNKNLRIVWNG